MAGYGRRIGAIFVDWIIANAIAALFFDMVSWVPLVAFALMHWLLIGVLGTTLGKLLFRIQVVRVGGANTGILKALIRTVLLLLVIPVVVIDEEGRGMHDRLAGTVEITM